MFNDFNRYVNTFDAHKNPGEREGFRTGRRPGGFMPEGALRCMPRGFGGPGRPGMPPFGGPMGPGHGMGPGFPPHGMGPRGPRRPDPDFLKRRLEDADLADLIDMAGRMLRRRPQGGPAQGQALVLSILLGREVLSQRELQQMLGIQPGSLSELLSKLEAKGFITREKAEDRRGNLLRITEAGRAAATEAADLPEDDPFSPLTVEQQDQLASSLRALLTHWIDQLDEPSLGQKPVEI